MGAKSVSDKVEFNVEDTITENRQLVAGHYIPGGSIPQQLLAHWALMSLSVKQASGVATLAHQ